MPEDLTALLEKLRKADPATCNEVLHFELAGYHQPRNQVLDHLQGCLQRACEARGWYVTIETSKIEPYLWRALIMRTDGRTWDHDAVWDSPATALLSAYISAIQS